MRLVADHDRVGVRDVARVAHEPLVRLDGHGAVGAVLLAQQRRRDAVRVAAVLQLAEELVHEVAAVGEDQDAARARGLHEAERGDGLAGTGRVLEPEPPGRTGILRLLGQLLLVLVEVGSPFAVGVPVLGLGVVLVLSSSSSSSSASRRRLVVLLLVREARAAPLPFWRSASAISAVSVPDSASTWCAESTVPSTSFGSSSDEQALEPEHQRVLLAPLDARLLEAGLDLGERSVERTAACRPRA